LSGNYQNLALEQDFSLFNMGGTQANGLVQFKQSWLGENNRSTVLNASAGYLIQKLDNEVGISALDITVEDVPVNVSVDFKKPSIKRYSNLSFTTQAGWLMKYESPVPLENEFWFALKSNYSFVQSFTGAGIQTGIDFNLNVSGQYALTDLPSHRRFSLSGPNKVASLDSGILSSDSAWFVESSLKYFDINFWKINTVFELQAQIAQGKTQGAITDQVIGLGSVLDLNIGPFSSKTKVFTDENFTSPKIWFEIALQWPGGI